MAHVTADIVLENQQLCLKGDLNFTNVMSVYEKSLALLNAGAAFQFNFSELHSSNSAALALMIEWLKLAKQKQQSISFQSLSPQLIALAKAAAVTDLLHL